MAYTDVCWCVRVCAFPLLFLCDPFVVVPLFAHDSLYFSVGVCIKKRGGAPLSAGLQPSRVHVLCRVVPDGWTVGFDANEVCGLTIHG